MARPGVCISISTSPIIAYDSLSELKVAKWDDIHNKLYSKFKNPKDSFASNSHHHHFFSQLDQISCSIMKSDGEFKIKSFTGIESKLISQFYELISSLKRPYVLVIYGNTMDFITKRGLFNSIKLPNVRVGVANLNKFWDSDFGLVCDSLSIHNPIEFHSKDSPIAVSILYEKMKSLNVPI